jgi:hypothetical protein
LMLHEIVDGPFFLNSIFATNIRSTSYHHSLDGCFWWHLRWMRMCRVLSMDEGGCEESYQWLFGFVYTNTHNQHYTANSGHEWIRDRDKERQMVV